MEHLNCTYLKTIYRDEKDGYTYFTVCAKGFDEYRNRRGELCGEGHLPIFTEGVPLLLTGTFAEKKSKYVFSVDTFEIAACDKEVMIRYLASSMFNGIGRKTAEKIISTTGLDVFGFLNDHADADTLIAEQVRDISGKTALEFVKKLRATMVQQSVYLFLRPFGGDFAQSIKICEALGTNALDKFKEDCYVAGSLAGLPFHLCDAVAKSLGVLAFNESRVEGLVKCALRAMENNGHMYASLDELYKCISNLVKRSAFHDIIPKAVILRSACKCKNVIAESDDNGIVFYLKPLWNAEESIVREISRIQNSASTLPFSSELVRGVEEAFHVTYADHQKCAFDFLQSSGIKILTGGPGTGKTTVVNGLIAAYKYMCPDGIVKLCAPTGRAAQRLSESTGMSASTIHHLIDYRPFGDDVTHKTQADPIEADMLVVDEMSMTDETLFALLLEAVKSNTLVILCGDTDQLPSVGAGKVLNDLISSKIFPVVTLNVIYRQQKDSLIVTNAIRVNHGNAALSHGPDFQFIRTSDAESIADAINHQVRRYFNAVNPYACQVLTSTKQGVAGTNALNAQLQQICNSEKPGLIYGRTTFCVGDKVMMIQNNFSAGYVNGDIGVVTSILDNGLAVNIGNEELHLTRGQLDDVVLSYAATIHKSQGSEYNTVIVALPADPSNMLKRNLLYTAITRAKERVIIVYEGDALKKAVAIKDTHKRHTKLSQKLNHLHYNILSLEENSL